MLLDPVLLSSLRSAILEGELAVFCGAGISMNSGLPDVRQIKLHLLDSLMKGSRLAAPANREKEAIVDAPMPFEYFLEQVFTFYENPMRLLSIYEHGKPNTNHQFLAALAKLGLLTDIYTTNFDRLLEMALGSNYAVHADERDFLHRTESATNIYKLHGSIENPDSIRTTIASIARRDLSRKRKAVIENAFFTGKHRVLLILGYSCSDDFDINPIINDSKAAGKRLYVIDHRGHGRVDIDDFSRKYPFSRFSGNHIQINTDDFIRRLWGLLSTDLPAMDKYRFVTSNIDLREWCTAIGSKNRLSILGLLWFRNAEFEKALRYFHAARRSVWNRSDKTRNAVCRSSIGSAYLQLGRTKQALANYLAALEGLQGSNQRSRLGVLNINIANCYDSLCQYDLAIKHYLESISILKHLPDKQLLGISYLNICNPYFNMGEYKKMIHYQRLSLPLLKDAGDKYNEAHGNINLGKAHWKLGRLVLALKFLNISLALFRKIGDKHGEANAIMDIGIIYFENGDLALHEQSQKQALAIFRKMKDPLGMANCHQNIGICAKTLRQHALAKRHLIKALALYGKILDISGQASCLIELGDISFQRNDERAAAQLWRKAESLYNTARNGPGKKIVEDKLSTLSHSACTVV
jgi:tetratricopeptide (TPR) repeat protein